MHAGHVNTGSGANKERTPMITIAHHDGRHRVGCRRMSPHRCGSPIERAAGPHKIAAGALSPTTAGPKWARALLPREHSLSAAHSYPEGCRLRGPTAEQSADRPYIGPEPRQNCCDMGVLRPTTITRQGRGRLMKVKRPRPFSAMVLIPLTQGQGLKAFALARTSELRTWRADHHHYSSSGLLRNFPKYFSAFPCGREDRPGWDRLRQYTYPGPHDRSSSR